MIEASFDRSSRAAAVSGVYQYDTGQRLRMRGLPSTDELLAGDDLLSGELVTVQVHYGYEGDEQTDMRLAQWLDGDWVVDIPDSYLTRIDPVHVYVYVYYGENGDDTRARTMYEGVFSAIGRPAPNNMVSEDMLDTWEGLKAEVQLVLVSSNTALANAKAQAESALKIVPDVTEAVKPVGPATDAANAAHERLTAMEKAFNTSPVQVVHLNTGADAYAKIDNGVVTLGLPKGNTGAKGETGDTGPSDIKLSIKDGVLTITPK